MNSSTISEIGAAGVLSTLGEGTRTVGSISSGSWLVVCGSWLGGDSSTDCSRFVRFFLRFASLSSAIRLFVSAFL